MAEISGDVDSVEDMFSVAAEGGTEELVRKWHSRSDELFLERGDQAGEDGYEVFQMVQGSVPPYYNEAEGAWEFHYPHFAAIIMELGSDPHKIEADEADWLAFEWPEMEGVEFGNSGKTFDEVFEDSWPTVFFKEVMHPGTDELRFMRDARDEVMRDGV